MAFMKCPHCTEPILEGETVLPPIYHAQPRTGQPQFHRECLIRCIIGSVGHQKRLCSCFGGTESDPAGLTVRQVGRGSLRVLPGFKRNISVRYVSIGPYCPSEAK